MIQSDYHHFRVDGSEDREARLYIDHQGDLAVKWTCGDSFYLNISSVVELIETIKAGWPAPRFYRRVLSYDRTSSYFVGFDGDELDVWYTSDEYVLIHYKSFLTAFDSALKDRESQLKQTAAHG